MISPLYRICNCLFVFRSSNRKLLLYIDVLLEKHRVGRGIIANEQIEVTLHEIGKVLFDNEEPYYESKKAKLFCIEQKQFALIKAEDIRTPNSLYYHFLDPMLKNVFRRKGVICLHGAGALIQGRGIIFLGNRNAGKSTISILNLLNGGKFLTDDVIYLDGGMAHTIYRPIHIDPKFAETIGIGGRIDINDKYLDKESEVNYYEADY